MIIIKNLPGLNTREILEELQSIDPTADLTTGHGGIVVDESLAYLFLRNYLTATGLLPTPAAAPAVVVEPVTLVAAAPKRRGRPPKTEG